MADTGDISTTTDSGGTQAGGVCVFLKKRPAGGAARGRKRRADEADDPDRAADGDGAADEDDDNAVVAAEAKRAKGVLTASTKNPKKEQVKMRYESTRTAKPEGQEDMGATARLEIDTEFDRDQQAIFERSQKIQQELAEAEGGEELYRGQAGYQQFLQRKESALGNAYKGFSAKGPLRASANIRTTVRWDYQPDICKDYKETGSCGYGDNCKFMHDRGDYKSGWQIDKEVDSQQQGNRDIRSYEIESSDDEDDKLPFACYICRGPFVKPVVTRCKHYFCEQCALQHHRKSIKCFVCGAKTQGVFNPAKDLMAKIERAKLENETVEPPAE